jgi:chemotaxis protein MotB
VTRRERPLIIRRTIQPRHVLHHGGAWKVAYADFVTAMMAFFLLLWLISSASDDTLRGLAEYFSEAKANSGVPGGSSGLLAGRTLLPTASPSTLPLPTSPMHAAAGTFDNPDEADPGSRPPGEMELSDDAFEAERERREQELFEQAEEAMEEAIEASPELRQYRENLMVERTPEGLRVQILDQDRSPMFPLGSDRMFPHMRKLLAVVVEAIRDLPNRVSIRGHTDALPFAADAGYDNWRLSSDRANVTRRAMVELGLQPGRVADVTGKGDSENLIADNAKDPRNRRISLVLLHQPPAEPHPVRAAAVAGPAPPLHP